MKRRTADAERLLFALAGPGHIAVGRDRHRKIGSGHIASIRLWLRRLYIRRLRWPEKLIGYPTGRMPMHIDEYRWQRSGLAVGVVAPATQPIGRHQLAHNLFCADERESVVGGYKLAA